MKQFLQTATPETAKQLAAQYRHGCMPRCQVIRLYELRDAEVNALAEKDVITVSDIHALERGGRFRVAAEMFEKCDEQATLALLHDEHHGVRAAASIAMLAKTHA